MTDWGSCSRLVAAGKWRWIPGSASGLRTLARNRFPVWHFMLDRTGCILCQPGRWVRDRGWRVGPHRAEVIVTRQRSETIYFGRASRLALDLEVRKGVAWVRGAARALRVADRQWVGSEPSDWPVAGRGDRGEGPPGAAPQHRRGRPPQAPDRAVAARWTSQSQLQPRRWPVILSRWGRTG